MRQTDIISDFDVFVFQRPPANGELRCGYEKLEEKLKGVGADIERVKDDEEE